jgi:tetratricopeptide (TPR) repeat protein
MNQMDEEKVKYFFESILTHLIETGRYEDAISILCDKDFLKNYYKFQKQNLGSFFGEIYRVYSRCLEEKGKMLASKFVPNLVGLITEQLMASDEVLTPEIIHAMLVYRQHTSLYEDILENISHDSYWDKMDISAENHERLVITFQTRLSNLHRRNGDMPKAERLIKNCLNRLKSKKSYTVEQLTELSRLEYELGYIHFLQGDAPLAIKFFDESAKYASDGTNKTSEWISRHVQMRCGFIYGTFSPQEFKATIEQALAVYKSRADQDSVARRWIMNANAHLLDVAFVLGEEKAVAMHLEALREDEWVKNIAPESFIKPFMAKLFILQQKWWEAIKCFEYLPQSKESLVESLQKSKLEGGYTYYEGLAEEYLHYGQALHKAGQLERAQQIWKIGLLCPGDYANKPWQQKITKIMKGKGIK